MDTIIEALNFLYGGGAADNVSEWIELMFDKILIPAFSGRLMSTAINVFAGIAGSLIIVYFFMDLLEKATNDMISFEKLILAFLKMLVAIAVVLNLQTIMEGLVNIGKYMWQIGSNIDLSFTEGADGAETFGEWSLPDKSYSLTRLIAHLGDWLKAFIITLVSLIVELLMGFLCVSNTLDILVRGIMSPIAIADCWSEGRRSQGIRYIKKFIGACILMGIMVLCMRVASLLGDQIITHWLNIDVASIYTSVQTMDAKEVADTISPLFDLDVIAYTLIPNIAGVGGMMGAKNIVNDIVGS